MLIYQINEFGVREFFLDEKIDVDGIIFFKDGDKVFVRFGDKIVELEKNKVTEISGMTFLSKERQYNYYKKRDKILFDISGDVISNIPLLLEGNILFNPQNSRIFVNYKSCEEEKVLLKDGDVVIVDNLVFSFKGSVINFFGDVLINTNLELINSFIFPESKYKKSPRIFKRFSDEKVEIRRTPIAEKVSGKTIAKIIFPPMLSIFATILMAYFTKRGVFAIIGMITTVGTITFSLTSYFQEKKMIKEENKIREEDYSNYLLSLRKKLHDLYSNELTVYNYNFPKSEGLQNLILDFSPRIYERDRMDDDFLTVSMGSCDQVPQYKLDFKEDSITRERDVLNKEAKEVYQKYNTINDVSYTINLSKGHVGLVGDKELIHDEIKRMLLELVSFHSYHDVKVMLLYEEMYKDDFSCFSWLNHFRIEENNISLNVFNDNIKEIVLSHLYQELKHRNQLVRDSKDEVRFAQHYVIYIDDFKLIVNHPIMEFLQSNKNLGFTIIVRVNQVADLTSNIKNVFVYEDAYNAKLLVLDGDEISKNLKRDTSFKEVDFQRVCRSLSILEHELGVTTTIPDSVDFLKMQSMVDGKDINRVEDIDIANKWETNSIYENISVPIGLKSEREVEYLDLHEKNHGPHGLIAGTTGSGKSEVIQTYIISLAINFSPEDVGFLLIDYKGGGMSNLFNNLPHVIGTITNLDGADSMRALVSIKAELDRRQKIFNANDVNNINNYTKLYKAGEVKEPLPHLFIISDEFAELKKEQPEFMTELISVARIGRTLGVHLILATQKPSGVVNDQIWSNSKFKISLKVQDESDSKEIIKTPDAAHITKTGRAYLQVGNNEIYELFQSAWSGAKYEESVNNEEVCDNRVYVLNDLGQEELINKDLSVLDEEARVQTQLDAIITQIKNIYDAGEFKQIPKAWQPSLEGLVLSPTSKSGDVVEDYSNIKETNLCLDIGLVDKPDFQKQENKQIDIEKDYNLALYGSSGYGKSFALQSFIIDLALKNNPELVYFYVIDLGNGGMVNIKNLPHVADYITFDNIDKLNKLLNILTREIESRKKLCLDFDVQNIHLYETQQNEVIPRIFIVVDNYQVLKEVNEEFYEYFEKLARDGYSVGIYLMFSTTKYSTTKPQLLNSVKTKLTLYQDDSGDDISIVGRTKFPINQSQKGRVLIKDGSAYQMQIYSPVMFENDVVLNENIRALVNSVDEKFSGEYPRPIPEQPTEFYLYQMDDYVSERGDEIKLGLTLSDVTQYGFPHLPVLLPIIGPSKSGKTNMIQIILSQLDLEQTKLCIIDTNKNKFNYLRGNDNVLYANDKISFESLHSSLFNKVEQRQKEATIAMETGDATSVEEVIAEMEEVVVIIDDLDYVYRNYLDQINLTYTVERGMEVGVHFIIGIDSTSTKPSANTETSSVYKICKSSSDYVVLGRQSTFTILSLVEKAIPKFKQGIINNQGEKRRILIPEYRLE